MDDFLPVGKLPAEILERLLAGAPALDARLLLGPGIGLDCAVLDLGDRCLVFKSDPITFATEEIGWYAVQVNANDLATTGALPRWLLMTLLLPESRTDLALVESIFDQVYRACREMGISVLGGHTEITYGLDRTVLAVTLIGEVERQRLVTPRGANPGDRLLLTQGVPIEATAILARELPDRLAEFLSPAELRQAADFLHRPGIGVSRAARLALTAGGVTAMHDPTEGGLAGALWELAYASQRALLVETQAAPIPQLSARICEALGIDPLAAIASGALLICVQAQAAGAVRQAMEAGGIPCSEIGWVEAGSPGVWEIKSGERTLLARPARDEIARIFGNDNSVNREGYHKGSPDTE